MMSGICSKVRDHDSEGIQHTCIRCICCIQKGFLLPGDWHIAPFNYLLRYSSKSDPVKTQGMRLINFSSKVKNKIEKNRIVIIINIFRISNVRLGSCM